MLYDEDRVIQSLTMHGDGEPAAVLPVCYDSLGNKHRAEVWSVFVAKNSIRALPDPGPGYGTWDDWWERRKAKRRDNDKRRSSHLRSA